MNIAGAKGQKRTTATESPSQLSRVVVKYRPSVGRHAYPLMSVDMSSESRPTHWPSIGRYIGRVSVTISADSIGRQILGRQMP